MWCKYIYLFVIILNDLFVYTNQRKPPDRLEIVTQPTSNYVTLDNRKYQFKCETNQPQAQIQWLFNGQPLNESPLKGFYTITTNLLTIRLNITNSMSKQTKSNLSSLKGRPLSSSSSSSSSSSLTTITTLQGGRIQCIAYYRKDALLSQIAKLLIPYLDPFPLDENNLTVTIFEGNTAVIPCKLPSSIPTVVSEFIYNDTTLIQKSNDRYQLMPSGNLHIIAAKQNDSGYYKCVSFNPYIREKHNSSNQIYLNVKQKAIKSRERDRNIKFSIKPMSHLTAILGTNVTLECVPNGYSISKVNWYKENGSLPKNRHYMIGTNLVLVEVRSTEDGKYVCEAISSVNGIKSMSTSTKLEIHEIPQIIIGLEDRRIAINDVIKFECIARGKPTPIISWFFNGNPIELVHLFDGSLYKESNGSRLIINKVTSHKFSGIYQCFAANELDSVTSYGRLTIVDSKHTRDDYDSSSYTRNSNFHSTITSPSTDITNGATNGKTQSTNGKKKNKGIEMIPPSRPEISRLTEDSVMVRWNVPKNDGLPILFFKVQYKEIGRHEWMTIDTDIAPHIHSFAVNNLRTGSTYRFRIAAVYSNNDNKSGKTSSKFILYKEPPMKRPNAPPLITDAVALSSTSIEIKWDYENNENVPMEGFFIHYRPTLMASEYLKITVEGAATRSHVMTHLSPETAYDIKMQCFNVAGASLFSNIFTSKTMVNPDSSDKGTANNIDENNENNNIITNYVPVTSKDDHTLYYIIGVSIGALLLVLTVIIIFCILRNKQMINTNNTNREQKVKNINNLKKSASLSHVSQANNDHHNGQTFYQNHNHHYHNHLNNGNNKHATISPHHSIIYPRSLHLSNGHLNNDKKLSIIQNDKEEIESFQIRLNQCQSTLELKNNNNLNGHKVLLETNERTNTTLTTVRRVSMSSVSQSSLSRQNSLERRKNAPRFIDESYPTYLNSNQRINNRVSSFSRLNGTLERKRKSRNDLVTVVNENKEVEPMLTKCRPTNNNTSMVMMQSSC